MVAVWVQFSTLHIYFNYFTQNTECSLIYKQSFPSSCENVSPCCIYFEQRSSANTEPPLLWPDGYFLSLMRIARRHLPLLPWLLRLQLAADDREEI